MSFKSRLAVLSTICSLALSACGGGGSSSPNNNAVTPPPPPPTNNAPTANAGEDITAVFSTTEIQLNGAASSDPDGDSLTYEWVISQQPDGSNISLSGAQTQTTAFEPSQAGIYTLTLTVTDPNGATDTDSVIITLTTPPPQSMQVYPLDKTFMDAEFDEVNERLVTLSGDVLTLIDKVGSQSEIALPLPANTVSIAPDGNFAAVSHLEKISYIDLTAQTIVSTQNVIVETTPLAAEFSDIVLDDNGLVSIFSSSQNPPTITLNVETGDVETNIQLNETPDESLYGVSPLEESSQAILLRPDGPIYSVGSFRIENLTFEGNRLNNPLYNGDQNSGLVTGLSDNVCNKIFLGIENDVLTGCHSVFRVSDNRENDRKYVHTLGTDFTEVQHASSSPYSRNWYVIDSDEPNHRLDSGSSEIDVYDVDTGEGLTPISLPNIANGASVDWKAKFVFASQFSDTLYVLAVDNVEAPQSQALLVYQENTHDLSNGSPVAETKRFLSAVTSEPVTLSAANSFDPEGDSLTYQWSIAAQPAGSTIIPIGVQTDTLNFTAEVAGAYEFELRAFDGNRYSNLAKSTVNVTLNNQDVIHRLDLGITDIQFSKSLNKLAYLSETSLEMVVIDANDFSKTVIPLSTQAYRLALSPDGQYAAVSHDKLVSLIDLNTNTLADTQITETHWGNLALDHNNIAHVSPEPLFIDTRYESNDRLFSTNFETGETVEGGGRVYKGTELKLHPTLDSIYGAWRGVIPSDIAKWDSSTFPTTSLGDSPYHGDFRIRQNLWITEDGDKILTQGATLLTANPNPAEDMIYIDTLPDIDRILWADHSTERNQWIATTSFTRFINEEDDEPTVFREYYIYDDATQELDAKIDIDGIQTSVGIIPVDGQKVFFSDDGSKAYLVLRSDRLIYNSAIQVIELD